MSTGTMDDPDVKRLVDNLTRELSENLAAVQQAGGTRALGSGVAGGTPSAPTDQDAQRFFGAILSGLVQHVVPAAAQGILGLLQQRRRELGLPEQRDLDRDFESILTALLPKLIDAVPGIITAVSGQSAPRSTEEEAERFLPFLAAVVPAVISAVPSIINAFNRQRGVAATTPPISDPDVAQRFIGPLLSSFVPQLLQSAPSILGSLFGGRREMPASTW
jgi:hypothetical protein